MAPRPRAAAVAAAIRIAAMIGGPGASRWASASGRKGIRPGARGEDYIRRSLAALGQDFLRRCDDLSMPQSNLTIRRLAPELEADFLDFFEGAAFADNPQWQSCYCQFLYVDHSKVNWSRRTAEENRSAACDRIACRRMRGLLAYREGKVVGWCNAAPRVLLDSFADEPIPDAEHVGQITCFVVAREHRRTGVARALLDQACAMLRDEGLKIAEANPSRDAPSDADNHFGPLSLYLSAGFSVVKERDDGLLIVRRSLP